MIVEFLQIQIPTNRTSWTRTRATQILFKDLQYEIDALRTGQPDLITGDINAASLVDVDAEVSAVQQTPTDAEILADFLETDNISDDELVADSDNVEDVPMECPLLHALELFQKVPLFAADGDTVSP